MTIKVQTSDWNFPLAIGDQVRVTQPQIEGYYGLDGIVESIDYDTFTVNGPSIVCKVVFPDGRTNTIARYALTFISAISSQYIMKDMIGSAILEERKRLAQILINSWGYTDHDRCRFDWEKTIKELSKDLLKGNT